MRTHLNGLLVASFATAVLTLSGVTATAQNVNSAAQDTTDIQLVSSETTIGRIIDLEADLASLKARLDASSSIAGGDCCSSCPPPCCADPGCFAGAEWLHWKARRDGLDYAHVGDAGGLSALGSKNQRLGFDRDDGVRLFAGYRCCSGWEFAARYTYFHTNDAESLAPTNGVIPTRVHPGDAPANWAGTANANASLDFDVLDFELGRWFHPNECTDVRVFGGFRWAIIDQDFNVTYDGGAYNGHTVSTPSNMDGYGIRIGTEGHYKTQHGFSIFGRSAISVLAGQFENGYLEYDALGPLTDVNDHITRAVPVLEAAMGVAYERGPLEIAAGYELTSWFNLADRPTYTSDGFTTGNNTNDTSDLLLEGIFVRVTFIR